jgi:hypothetical protein
MATSAAKNSRKYTNAFDAALLPAFKTALVVDVGFATGALIEFGALNTKV